LARSISPLPTTHSSGILLVFPKILGFSFAVIKVIFAVTNLVVKVVIDYNITFNPNTNVTEFN
jgi:hypothetical protein